MGARVRDMTIAWIVLEMTDSKLWVGVVNGLPAVSIIFFSLLGGVLADCSDRRVLLLWSRLTMGILAFLAAFLVTAGLIELWHLIVIAFLAVGVNALDMPISRTLIFDVVGRGRLLVATSLNSMVMDIGSIVGPSVAGVLMADVGVAAALYVLGGVYLAAFATLLMVRCTSRPGDRNRSEIVRDLVAGFRYIRSNPEVARLVALGATVPLAGIFFSMMPIYTRDVFDRGAGGLGIIVAMYGVGSLVGSVSLTVLGDIDDKRRTAMIAAVVYAVGVGTFAFTSSLQAALAPVFVLGMAATYWKNTTNTLVQTAAADEMRGRVMSIYSMGVQMLAFGWLLGGVLATLVGNQGALIIAGVLMAGLNLYVYARSRAASGASLATA